MNHTVPKAVLTMEISCQSPRVHVMDNGLGSSIMLHNGESISHPSNFYNHSCMSALYSMKDADIIRIVCSIAQTFNCAYD